MSKIHVSVAGAGSLLGQHLLQRLSEDPDFIVESLHDHQVSARVQSLTDLPTWQGDGKLAATYAHVPVFAADASALAPNLLSFLPDLGAEEIERAHLARGTRVLTHCEYARLNTPLLMPGVTSTQVEAQHFATPNCTTALTALPLFHLNRSFGITGATITTLQAISGSDLPGLHASVIHDQVTGHLPGEAEALAKELDVLLGGSFPIHAFATRVPVWRGHTITMAVDLEGAPDLEQITACLAAVPDILVTGMPVGRDRFSPSAPLSTIVDIRKSASGVLMVLKGDNLEAATTGVMHSLAREL